jgi:hypothetical protein
MKHKKMSLMAQKIGQTFRNAIKKSIIYLQCIWSYAFFNEVLQPRAAPFFCEKDDLGQK